MSQKRKLAVFFPGTGYHTDKPLFYYSRKIAAAKGYEVLCIIYGELPEPKEKNEAPVWDEVVNAAIIRAKEQLEKVKFQDFDRVVFVSKSIGTAVAASVDREWKLCADHIFYTPVAESFQVMGDKGVVFHGTADPLAYTAEVIEECKRRTLPLHLIEEGNHSLETGNPVKDISILKGVMEITEDYLEG